MKRANSVLVRFAPRYVAIGIDDILNVAIGGNVKSVPVIAEHRHLCSDYLLVNLKGIHRREVWTWHNQRSRRHCIRMRKSDTRLSTVALQRKRKEHGQEVLEQQGLENQHLIWRWSIRILLQEWLRRLGPSCRPMLSPCQNAERLCPLIKKNHRVTGMDRTKRRKVSMEKV